MMDFGFNGFEGFDFFNTPVEEEKKDEKVTKKTAAKKESKAEENNVADVTTPAGISFEENLEAEEDDDNVSLSTSDDAKKETKKGSKKAASTTKKADVKLKGIVKVAGDGWTINYGEDGKEYQAKDVVKALYEQGYKEVALAEIKYTSTTLFVHTISESVTADDTAMGDSITISLGNLRVNYTTEDFAGLSAEEISLFDVELKFQNDNPDFRGCGLKFDSMRKIATPVFSKKVEVKADETYNVWSDNGIQQYVGADLKDSDVYVSTTGVYFVSNKVPKSAQQVYSSMLDLPNGDGKAASKAKEMYRLPFELWVETYGRTKACTEADFGGKSVVTKEDIISYLSGAYRIFRSSQKKFSIAYDRNAAIVGVAVVSGEKGATDVASVSSNVIDFADCKKKLISVKERIEETALGLFKGYETEEEMLSLDVFEMALPKIPGEFLDTIIKEFRRDLTKENMVQIYYSVSSMSYYLVKPRAEYTKVSVKYTMTHTRDILVMSVHSHNTMAAKFSSIDDADEIYTGLFGVIGNLDKQKISVSFRAGMEGKFKPLSYADIFTNGGDIA